ncbi:MAG: chorismate synthase [Bacteroidales bacterium]|nr:chorismate synthase [Bacteroidales bacterium]
MANSFGTLFRLTDFGETHGPAVGGIIDGCPAGVIIDNAFIDNELMRRAASDDEFSTSRREPDAVEFLSGIYQGKTLGTPIAFVIRNCDVQVNVETQSVIKPSHASFVYKEKYGHADNYGNGRASARQTVCRVVAGAVAKLFLKTLGVEFESSLAEPLVNCPDDDTVGAKIFCKITHVPVGLGEPIYDKLDARLAYAMLSINAAKGFEMGRGFHAAGMLGSEYNDRQSGNFKFLSNNDGGVQAGISNGEDIYFNVAFKPIPTLQRSQETIDFNGNKLEYRGSSRNDRSVYPRVLPVVEAMAALVIADFVLLSQTNRI